MSNDRNLELLRAKEAIFKLIAQFHHLSQRDGTDELYFYNYCASALEAAWNVLGIEEDYVSLTEFCQMWEDNDRAIWAANSNPSFGGLTADFIYDILKNQYVNSLTESYEDEA